MTTSTRLSHVMLAVEDIDRSVAFYAGTLGLDLLHRTPAMAFLDAGGTTIVVRTGFDAGPGDAVEIVLESPDVHRTFAAWRQRGVAFRVELRPVMQAGGRHLVAADFRDPDGHLLSLTGWVEAAPGVSQ